MTVSLNNQVQRFIVCSYTRPQVEMLQSLLTGLSCLPVLSQIQSVAWTKITNTWEKDLRLFSLPFFPLLETDPPAFFETENRNMFRTVC